MNTQAINRDTSGDKLVWAAITLLGVIMVGYLGWLGYAVTTLQQQVAAIDSKVDTIRDNTAEVRRPQRPLPRQGT